MKRASTDKKMHREGTHGEKFPITISGTLLGAAYENTPYCCVKAIERVRFCINQGGTAGYPVPSGDGCPAVLYFYMDIHNHTEHTGKENQENGKG